jgi:hypothetical protein
MSVLVHEWIIMVEANSAHDIEQLYIDSVSLPLIHENSSSDKLSRCPKQTYLIFNKLDIFIFLSFYIFIKNNATIT